MTVRFASIMLLSSLAGGCASTTYQDKAGDARVRTAFEQPFRDVSLLRENPPDMLIRAAEKPYDLIDGYDCASLQSDISSLNLILGPDLDQVLVEGETSDTDGRAILSGAIASLVGLPYRGFVRRLSGAGKREEALRKAILAGMIRRGFLKGLFLQAGCSDLARSIPGESLHKPEDRE